MREMPRFELQHPHDHTVTVAYGVDPTLPGAFFAAIDFGRISARDETRGLIEYDGFQAGFCHEYPLRSALEFLSQHGVFALDELNEGVVWWDLHGDKRPPKRLRIVVEIIANLKRAAD